MPARPLTPCSPASTRSPPTAPIASAGRRGTQRCSPSRRTTCPPRRKTSLVERTDRVRQVEREGGNVDLEEAAVASAHRIAAGHEARRRGQRASRRILEAVAGAELGLLADDP